MSAGWLVVSHGLWIAGLAIVLAVLSWAWWIAGEEVLRQAPSTRSGCLRMYPSARLRMYPSARLRMYQDVSGRKSLGAVLSRRGPRRALDVGAAVFCSGLAATGRAWWGQVLWALLAAVWAARALLGQE